MPARTDQAPACKTCEFWDPRYPENLNLGVCTKMSVLVFPAPLPGQSTDDPMVAREASVSVHTDDGIHHGDFEAIRTKDTFGCRGHSDFIMMRYQEL